MAENTFCHRGERLFYVVFSKFHGKGTPFSNIYANFVARKTVCRTFSITHCVRLKNRVELITKVDLKKSYKADLEHRRGRYFLLGLVFVLAAFVVAFEYTSHPADQEDTSDMIDDMAQDVEMMPAAQTQGMIAAAPSGGQRSLGAKLNVVDHDVAVVADEKPVGSSDGNGTGGGTSNGTGSGTATAGAGESDSNSSAISPVAVDQNDNPLNFQVVERLPEFPGGIVEFMKWLTKNLRYPVLARQQNIQGKVIVSFIINKDGSITAQKVVQSVSPELDREALRVLKIMPRWKPGEEHGKPCRTYFSIPINFKI